MEHNNLQPLRALIDVQQHRLEDVGKCVQRSLKLSLKYFSKTFLLGCLSEGPEVYCSGDMKPFIQGPVERMQTRL